MSNFSNYTFRRTNLDKSNTKHSDVLKKDRLKQLKQLKQFKQLKELQLFREAVTSDEVGQLQKLKQL